MGKKINLQSNILLKKPKQNKDNFKSLPKSKPISASDFEKMIATSSCQKMSNDTLDLTNDDILEFLNEPEMISEPMNTQLPQTSQSIQLSDTMTPPISQYISPLPQIMKPPPPPPNKISNIMIEKLSKHLNLKYNFYYENHQAMCLINEKLQKIIKECEEKENNKKQKEMELQNTQRSLEESLNEKQKLLSDINVIYTNCGFK